MKVKIGNKTYDAEKEPIMITLTDSDKSNIKNMLPHYTKYVAFPDSWDKDDINKWAEDLKQ